MPTYARHDQALHAMVGEELVVLNPQSLTYYEFNEVAARIWELLSAGPRTADELVTSLSAEFEVDPDRARQSVAAFLADVTAKGLVTEQ